MDATEETKSEAPVCSQEEPVGDGIVSAAPEDSSGIKLFKEHLENNKTFTIQHLGHTNAIIKWLPQGWTDHQLTPEEAELFSKENPGYEYTAGERCYKHANREVTYLEGIENTIEQILKSQDVKTLVNNNSEFKERVGWYNESMSAMGRTDLVNARRRLSPCTRTISPNSANRCLMERILRLEEFYSG